MAEGPKIVAELIASDSIESVELFALESWIDANMDLLQSKHIVYNPVTSKELKKVSTLQTPNLVLLLAKIPVPTVNHSLTTGMHIFCDRIQDPGNLGTIIRIADWFGISSVATSENSVDFYNPKVVQATMGSICRLPLRSVNDKQIPAFIGNFKDVIGASMSDDNLYETKLPKDFLLVVGNESVGISRTLQSYCTKNITVPSAKDSNTESLNVAIASSIICSEYRRSIGLR